MADPRTLGRYELRRVLGKGAMGVVYEGFDPALNRRVAIKTVLKSAIADEETATAYVARFAREAKAVARLNHPNVVQVFDFGDAGALAYLVMEFIEGRDLRACFEAGDRFAPAEAVRIACELLGALDFAHEAGVIHRDVKPANVMLDAQRRVKLADFGVARLLDGSERSKTATMVGTPAFMSPEQISGARVDKRTDLFSAGIVLYQLLTGEQPFKGDGEWTVAKSIVQDEPPRPSTVTSTVSPLFDSILNKALAKKPDQRFASARDFAAALSEAHGGRAAAAQNAPQASDTELEFWRSIQNSGDAAELRLYLKNFPQGIYAELAQLKLAKLAAGAATEPEPEGDLSALSEQKAKLEAELARREAEFRRREAELEQEARARVEEAARRDAEEQKRAEAEERARQEAVNAARREAQAELERKEAEYRRREAEARERAQAEARARAEAEARAKQDARRLAAQARAEAEARAAKEATALALAKEEAEARARREAEERARREAESASREAEAKRREQELRKQLAAAPRPKLAPLLIASTLVILVIAGGWYWYDANKAARLAELTVALENAARASRQFDEALQHQQDALRELDLARAREEEARKAGDLAKLKEAQDAAKRAETEAAKQAELVKQKEAEKLAADKAATTKAAADKAAAEKLAAERATAEKVAAEKAAAAKATADKAAAEKAVAEKAAAEKLAAEKAAAEKRAAEKLLAEKAAAPKAPRAAGASGLPLPKAGERWVYNVVNLDNKDQKYEAALEVKSANASGVNYAFQEAGRPGVTGAQKPGTHVVASVAPGVALLSPYLMYFESLRAGDLRGMDSRDSSCYTNRFPCNYFATVTDRERVSVPAGIFDTRRIDVLLVNAGSGIGARVQYRYWFDEATGMLVKYQRRVKETSSYVGVEPDADMELVARVLPGAQSTAATALRLPAAGDRWVYSVRSLDSGAQVHEVALEVKSTTSSQISYAYRSEGGTDIAAVQKSGVNSVTKFEPGVFLLSPYLLFYEKLQPGDLRAFDGRLSCLTSGCNGHLFATVVGKERISIRAGAYETWRVEAILLAGAGQSASRIKLTYWFDEATGMLTKYQRRIAESMYTGIEPEIDMELLSYTVAK